MTDASDTVATLRVSTHQQRRDGRGVSAEQPGHDQQIPRLGEHAKPKQEQYQPRHMSQDRGGCYQHKTSQQEGQVADEPGDQPKKEVPNDQDARVHRGDDGIVVAVSIFQHLAAQKIYGQFVQDIFRELIDRFHTGFLPSKQRKKSSMV